VSLPNKEAVIPVVELEQQAASLADGYTGPGPLVGLGANVHSESSSVSVRGVGKSPAVDMEARACGPQV